MDRLYKHEGDCQITQTPDTDKSQTNSTSSGFCIFMLIVQVFVPDAVDHFTILTFETESGRRYSSFRPSNKPVQINFKPTLRRGGGEERTGGIQACVKSKLSLLTTREEEDDGRHPDRRDAQHHRHHRQTNGQTDTHTGRGDPGPDDHTNPDDVKSGFGPIVAVRSTLKSGAAD